MNITADLEPPILAAPVPPRPRKRRWWLVALIVLGLIAVLAIVSVLGVVWFARSAIRRYTDTRPEPLPKVQTSNEDGAAVRERLGKFFQALKGSDPLEPLELTASDLNALIASSGGRQFRDRLYITIDDAGIHGQFSVPLGKDAPGLLKGRYLNGQGDLKVFFQDGELRVWVENLAAHGQPVPKLLMKHFSGRNLAEGLMNNQEALKTIQQLESITVTNGALVLQPKAP